MGGDRKYYTHTYHVLICFSLIMLYCFSKLVHTTDDDDEQSKPAKPFLIPLLDTIWIPPRESREGVWDI